jgi:uncharacterized repeat protein (TIGR01451 family)
MTRRVQPDHAGTAAARDSLRPLPGTREPQAKRVTRVFCGWVLLLLLGWASAAPAHATGGTISTPVAGPIIVFAGETLTIVDGGSVTTSAANTVGVAVQDGGTLNINGGSVTGGPGSTLGIFLGSLSGGATLTMTSGSVSGGFTGVQVSSPGSTATISGGSMSGGFAGLNVGTGTATISGGSFSGSFAGLYANGGTVTVSGCNLALANGVLTGTWQDGMSIDTAVAGPITLVVDPTPPTIALTGANPLTVECHTLFTDPGATAHDACGGSVAVTTSSGVDVNTPGRYTITYSATIGANPATPLTRTVNVVDTTPPVITLSGSNPMSVDCQVQGSFTDPGATASDACAGSVPVTPSGTVDVNTPGTYTLTYNATDGANPTTPVTRTVIVVPVADVSVTQMAGPNPVPTGSTLTYAVVVSNAGPQSAQGVVLTDSLPAGTSFVSAMATSGTLTTPRGNSSTVSWSLPSLAKSGSVTLTIVVKVMAKAGTMLTNAASVSSSPKDPNLANNSASVSTAVLPRH